MLNYVTTCISSVELPSCLPVLRLEYPLILVIFINERTRLGELAMGGASWESRLERALDLFLMTT